MSEENTNRNRNNNTKLDSMPGEGYAASASDEQEKDACEANPGEHREAINMSATIRHAFLNSIPVMAGYIVTGMGFGILLATQGYGPIWAVIMVLIIYAGSMQFVALDLMVAGADLVTSALMTLMVNVRHLFYSISMVGPYHDTGKFKPYLGYALTDETYALVCQLNLPDNVDKARYCFFLSLMNQSYWMIGCVSGDIIGITVDFDFSGIDFAMTAMFVAIATEQWLKAEKHYCALTGLIISVLCLVIFGSDSFLIPTMILIIAALSVEKKLGWLPATAAEADAIEKEENRIYAAKQAERKKSRTEGGADND